MTYSPKYCLQCERPKNCSCGTTEFQFRYSHRLRPPLTTSNKVVFRKFLIDCPQFSNCVSDKLKPMFLALLKKVKLFDTKLNGREWTVINKNSDVNDIKLIATKVNLLRFDTDPIIQTLRTDDIEQFFALKKSGIDISRLTLSPSNFNYNESSTSFLDFAVHQVGENLLPELMKLGYQFEAPYSGITHLLSMSTPNMNKLAFNGNSRYLLDSKATLFKALVVDHSNKEFFTPKHEDRYKRNLKAFIRFIDKHTSEPISQECVALDYLRLLCISLGKSPLQILNKIPANLKPFALILSVGA